MKNRAARERLRLLTGAQEFYRRALQADPGYALAQIRLGRVHFLFKNLRPAGEWLAEGPRRSDGSGASVPRGHVHCRAAAGTKGSGRGPRRIRAALTIAPQSQNAVVGLAYVELMSGRPDTRRHSREATSDRRLQTTRGGPTRTARSIRRA